jgi:hypothetical protein
MLRQRFQPEAMLAAVIAMAGASCDAFGQSTGSRGSSAPSAGPPPFGGGESGKPVARMPTARIPAAVSSGCWGWPIFTPPVFVGPYYGYYPFGVAPTYPPPPILLTPTHPSTFVIPGFGSAIPPPPVWGGDNFVQQPAALVPPAANAARREADRNEAAARAARRAAERVAEDIKVGDRLFRADEFARAERRYREAVQANPNIAEPHLRLAQVAIARKDYAHAARHIHDAQTAEPGWQLMAQPRDIQNLFGDPAEFARTLGDLESHLQANPEDRDGWLVLGTELYLTGRTERAHDSFLRLTDRKADPTLAGFLDMMPAAR